MMRSSSLSKAGLVTGVVGFLSAISLSPIAALGQSDDTNSSSSEASVTVEAECKWFIYNVPSKITLSPEEDQKYAGQALTLTGSTTDLTIRKSGTDEGADSFSDCSFFGDKTDPTLFAEVDGTTFDATYGSGTEDTGMDFTIATDGNSGFKVKAGECTANTNVWNENVDGEFLTLSYLASPVLTFTSNDDVNNSLTSAANTQECQSDFTYEVTIPADQTPSNPGETYSYTGPSVEFTAVYSFSG